MDPDLSRQLLGFEARATLSFAPALLRANDPVAIELITRRLKRMRPDIPVARLMHLTHDPSHITPEYLAGVIEVLTGGQPSLALRSHVAACLQSVVVRLGEIEGPESPGRLEAIRVIGRLGVPTGVTFLEGLVKRRKLMVFAAEPRRVRDAVVEALGRRSTTEWAA
jgi:hypothetical protein